MKWKLPPPIKIYEALGAIADNRVKIERNEATVSSSSGKKFYTVKYDANSSSIMANDNGSYWQGYLGYPAITYLMSIGVITYNKFIANALRGISWKDLNTKFKSDYAKTADYVHEVLQMRGITLADFQVEVENILSQLKKLNLSHLGQKAKPPVGY